MTYIIATRHTLDTTPGHSRAVATLDEARYLAEDLVRMSFCDDSVTEADWQRIERAHGLTEEEIRDARDDRGPDAIDLLAFDCRNLPESGGTVGPLPDGTVIEVKQVGS